MSRAAGRTNARPADHEGPSYDGPADRSGPHKAAIRTRASWVDLPGAPLFLLAPLQTLAMSPATDEVHTNGTNGLHGVNGVNGASSASSRPLTPGIFAPIPTFFHADTEELGTHL